VVDLSRVLGGPFCTQILGDHGAQVIKIEPPQGDETRGWGPPFADAVASYFLGVNRNKTGLVLDLSEAAGREALLAHLLEADVLVENFKPGTMEKWGIGADVLRERFPRLIHCRITGFGADGPLGGLPGYDAAIQALSGIMSVNGEARSEPLRAGVPIVDMVCGMNAALGILLALHERKSSGLGQFIEASLYDSGLSLLHPHAANYFLDGRTPRRTGNAHPNIYPYDSFATGQGPIFLAVGNDRQFRTLCERIGAGPLADDPRFTNNAVRSVNREALRNELEKRLANFQSASLADDLIRAGVPCAPILSIPEALAHPHTAHREMVVRIGEHYTGIGSPIKLSRTPAAYRLPPPAFHAGVESE
jgi:crotonobetainyl-CoA:carnitine CoA-transferase CaiB-like acyl-CoA transferase